MQQKPHPAYQGLILQKKWENMAVYMYGMVLRHMPRLDRNTLGTEIMQSIWRTERLLVQVAHRATGRVPLLQQIDVEAKTVLRMVAMGVTMGSIPQKKYALLSEMLVEIGKIVGGLLKK